MKISEKIIKDVVVLTFKGEMIGGFHNQKLHDHIKELVKTDFKKFIIDLKNVPYVNSSGLGILMATQTTVKNTNGQLKLTGIKNETESILIFTQLIQVFDVSDNVEEALENFN